MICDKLNVIGTMKDLRRTKEWNFDVSKANTIDDIKNNNYKLYKARDFLNYKTYNLKKDEYFKAQNGNKIYLKEDTKYIILIYKGEEIAIYEKEEDYYKAKIMLI